jgi:hypothetical protein
MTDQPNDEHAEDALSAPGPEESPSAITSSFLKRLKQVSDDDRDLTPLEIRTRLLDDVVRTFDPYRGPETLPFNSLDVHILAPIAGDRARYEAAMGGLEPPFDVAARHRLKEAGFKLPSALPVVYTIHETVPEALRPAFEKYGTVYIEPKKSAPATHARLEIERGRAEQEVYAVEGAGRINIGRLRQVADGRERIFRRNDVVFLDPEDSSLSAEESSINQTVSREHAHLTFDVQQGRFLWHNENGSTTLNRVSYQRPMPVGKQPLPLEDGDELYLGQAYLVFHLGRADEQVQGK